MAEGLLNLSEYCSCGEPDMKPKIILAVRDVKRKEAYLAGLESSAECTVTASLREIPDLLRKVSYKGILIDVCLNVKANFMEKIKISDSIDAMPSATLNFAAGRGLIKLLMLNQNHGTARTLEEFAMLCSSFQPKIVYPHNRISVHLNAALSPTPAFDGNVEHTFTMNVSGGGCFLFTASRTAFQPQDMVWIDFVGLANRSPILGKVCWKCDWGVSHAIPGIYVSFEFLLEAQYEEIQSLVSAGKHSA
jgi:hypothetical protein